MKYQIIGQTVPVVEVNLNQGEGIVTQGGGMFYQTEGIRMDTNARGGIGSSIGRMFAGESIFMNTYTAEVPNATIAFSSSVPGNIIAVDVGQLPNGITM